MEENEIIFSWNIPEYNEHEKGKLWYIIALGITTILLLYAFFTLNFLFAVIIIISAIVVMLNDHNTPELVNFKIGEEGIQIGKKFHDYDEIKNFAIIYKPKQNIKQLYFEFESIFIPHLSIPILDNNPLPIREYLLKYLKEDLDRKEPPLSEQLSQLFKL